MQPTLEGSRVTEARRWTRRQPREPRSEERRVGKECRSRGGEAQAEDGIRDGHVTGVQTCALPISTDHDANCDRRRDARYYAAACPRTVSLKNTRQQRASRVDAADARGLKSHGSPPLDASTATRAQIGRASCRERV